MQDKKTVKIAAMCCAHCGEKIKNALGEVDKVDRVDIDLDNKWAEVFFDPADAPDDAALEAAANDAGFDVDAIE